MKDKKISLFLSKIFKKTKSWFLRFLQVQLVIALALLIILPSWGIPISLLSPLGNMLFTPIFMAFLILCSLIFFFEILHIPNLFFIFLSEKLSQIWFFLTPDFHNYLLVGFTKPPLLFLILVPLATLAILTNKKINSLPKSIIALALLFTLSCAYLKLINTPKNFVRQIACHGGNLIYIHEKNKNILIDPGFLGKRLSACSFVQYSLVPEIIRSSGTTCIDHLIILQPGKITFDAITYLCTLMVIKNIDLIVFDGKMKCSTLRSFFALKKEIAKRNIFINRIGRHEKIIPIRKDYSEIILRPLTKKIKYNQLVFPAMQITYNAINTNNASKTIDNNRLTIYSAKYKKKNQLSKK